MNLRRQLDHALTACIEHPVFIISLLFIAFFLGLGAIPLVDLDEGAFSAATMEMLIRQDFITTYLGGELRFDKPILIYWLQAASVSIFGLNEFGLRLPSAIMASLWALAIYFFTRQHCDKKSAVVALTAMATSAYIIVVGRAAVADALLNFWLCMTMLSGYKFFETGEKKYSYWGYAFIGLGLLTKGPIAVLVPGAVTLIYTLMMRSWPRFWRLAFNPVGWMITLAIALPWYVLEYLDQGMLFIDGFIFKHNVERFSETMEQHGGSIFYYLLLLPVILLPLTGLFLNTLRRLRTLFHGKAFDTWMWLWFVFVFVFFSLSGTQLPHYVLYGATPLFILMGKYHRELLSYRLTFIPILIWLVLAFLLPLVLPYVAEAQNKLFVKTQLEDAQLYYHWSYSAGVGALIALVALIWYTKPRSLINSLLAFAWLHTLVVVTLIVPYALNTKQDAVKQAGILARQYDQTVVMHGITFPTFAVYRGAVTPKRKPVSGEIVFTKISNAEKYGPADILFSQSGYLLLKLD